MAKKCKLECIFCVPGDRFSLDPFHKILLDLTEQVAEHMDRAFQSVRLNPQQDLDQTQFVDAYKKVVLEVAMSIRQKPLTVAHADKVFDGSSISALLKDKQALNVVRFVETPIIYTVLMIQSQSVTMTDS